MNMVPLVNVVVSLVATLAAPNTHDHSPTFLDELDQLVIPVSALMGTPPVDDPPPATSLLLRPASSYDKRSGRRFSTTSREEVYQVCSPSRHEVIRLLVALHEARQGHNTEDCSTL
ncbi:hypothetical protein Hamer_G018239 [Homarus americanus]|uniref:Secreted protein n=1 Tax=Homarus americanus TaxID=6706 RepID=A0A8J5JD15_HOMAM|nr:hypothetical protein Hamer_G018239 [Homarus americanus]